MRLSRNIGLIILVLAVACLSPAAWAKKAKSKPTKHSAAVKSSSKKVSGHNSKSAKSKSKKGKKAWQARGQQSITDDRTREIQAALIRDKYMTGEPSGQMDAATRQALVRLQQENGWQTKIVPDSRALIKLGLGPSHENLLNPESAAVQSAVASRQ